LIRPASRTTLYQEVLRQMLEAIKEGAWAPGEKIPSEMELAHRFEVGRNSIREATKALAVFGILESKPGQGTFVSREVLGKILNTELIAYLSDDSSWIELMQIRLLLEAQTAYWAAEKAKPEDVEKLRSILSQSTNGGANKHPRDSVHLKFHSDFHETIAEIAENKLALRLLRSVRHEIDAQRHKYIQLTNEEWEKMIEEHEEIIEHISNHQPELAREAMRHHLMKGLHKVMPEKKIT